MPRTITVKGTGQAFAKPDTIVISIPLYSRDEDYAVAMEMASASMEDITNTLLDVGFEKEDIKTTNFCIQTDCKTSKNQDNNYQSEIREYTVKQFIEVQFALDIKVLSAILAAISECKVHPTLSVSFIVKDISIVKEEALRSATENARKKAEIICDAAGVKLGNLLSVNYSWSELNLRSTTQYDVTKECLPAYALSKYIDIEPYDIDFNDTVEFVWEIID